LHLQVAIACHGIVPNNLNLVPISIIFFLQQFIVVTANILPTINVPTFADLVGEFFRVLELEFSIKNFEFFL
jgi:hypothetical protein